MRTVIFLSTLILPTSLFAATLSSPVAEFRAEARVSVNISAEFVGSGEDASGFLYMTSKGAFWDSGTEFQGNSTTGIDGRAGLNAFVSATISGEASPEDVWSYASADFIHEPYYHYACSRFSCENGNMTVSLEFEIQESAFSAANELLGGSATVGTRSALSISACPNSLEGSIFTCDGPLTRLGFRTGSGRFQTQVSPGGWVSVSAFAGASGEARYEEPSVVPLPASATSLLAAFGLLGAAQMRNRRHRRQGLS